MTTIQRRAVEAFSWKTKVAILCSDWLYLSNYFQLCPEAFWTQLVTALGCRIWTERFQTYYSENWSVNASQATEASRLMVTSFEKVYLTEYSVIKNTQWITLCQKRFIYHRVCQAIHLLHVQIHPPPPHTTQINQFIVCCVGERSYFN